MFHLKSMVARRSRSMGRTATFTVTRLPAPCALCAPALFALAFRAPRRLSDLRFSPPKAYRRRAFRRRAFRYPRFPPPNFPHHPPEFPPPTPKSRPLRQSADLPTAPQVSDYCRDSAEIIFTRPAVCQRGAGLRGCPPPPPSAHPANPR